VSADPPRVAPRDEMNALLDSLLGFAKQVLEKHSEFYPFAASVSSQGEVGMVGAYVGEERPSSQEVIDALYEALTGAAKRSEIRAAGVCVDVRLSGRDEGDAVRAALEHAKSDPVYVFLPYKRSRLRGTSYGELFATAGERRIFV
jgi:hypothetical protein